MEKTLNPSFVAALTRILLWNNVFALSTVDVLDGKLLESERLKNVIHFVEKKENVYAGNTDSSRRSNCSRRVEVVVPYAVILSVSNNLRLSHINQ